MQVTISLRVRRYSLYHKRRSHHEEDGCQRWTTAGCRVLDGITRATGIAKLSPGATIRVEVVGKLRRSYAGEPKIGDLLP
jgi:hypothetical protein